MVTVLYITTTVVFFYCIPIHFCSHCNCDLGSLITLSHLMMDSCHTQPSGRWTTKCARASRNAAGGHYTRDCTTRWYRKQMWFHFRPLRITLHVPTPARLLLMNIWLPLLLTCKVFRHTKPQCIIYWRNGSQPFILSSFDTSVL